jgi:hypothetical protein
MKRVSSSLILTSVLFITTGGQAAQPIAAEKDGALDAVIAWPASQNAQNSTSAVDAIPAPQAQQPSVVEQNRVVPPRDAVNGADWLKAQGVQQGLDQLGLGADSKDIRLSLKYPRMARECKLS